ncbi:MAG: polyphenol oxidase family protein [Clostridiales bacterium]|nr:polyphenol oxidase family protein [Clostridiales bacterium]
MTDFEKAFAQISIAHGYHTIGKVGVFTLPLFSALPDIDHGFSARTGGISPGCHASLNLSFSRPEPRDTILSNFHIFCRACDIPVGSLVMDCYAHDTEVLPVTADDCGRGFTREPLAPCDGLVTQDPACTLMTGHADCMAFYCYDPVTRSIGLAHAGWRGALNRMGASLIAAMVEHYRANPKDIYVGVGPSICPSCFEVGEDVAQLFDAAYPELALRGTSPCGKTTIDLWRVACCQFFEAGILPEHMQLMGVCTVEEPERLYSHRRDRGETGGMTAYLRLI